LVRNTIRFFYGNTKSEKNPFLRPTTLKEAIVFMQIIKIFLGLFFISNMAFAARVLQHKNGKILIDLEGEEASVDQKMLLINSAGKKVAIATITQIKGSRAIALINKGKSDGSETVRLAGAKATSAKSSDSEDTPSPMTEDSSSSSSDVYRLNGTKFSAVLTLAANSMSTKQTDGSNPTPNTEDVALKGSSLGFTGILDYPAAPWLVLRGTLGYEPFTVSGTSQFLSCDGLTSTECNADITYLSAGGYARFDLTRSRATAWLALGFTLKQPLSKKTTALLADDIKTTTTYALATGIDFFVSNKNFIPISAEYQLFQSSETVTANIILLRAGYGWSF
jgi:hypothetical protein